MVSLIGAGSAFVFEGAAKASLAVGIAQAAAPLDDPSARAAHLAEAASAIETSWARPTAWHGGANETLSWVLSRQARDSREGASELREQSARAGERAVMLSPIQPESWARLASLADRGVHTICAVQRCIENSWRASKFTDTVTACARLRLAHRYGMLAPEDERIEWFARSTLHQRDVLECLIFLPEPELFHVLMLFEIEEEIQERRR